jgi:hypothetical protein
VAEPPEDWGPHLGRKVSIRFRLHDDPEHSFSEAIGVIQSVDPDRSISIVKRDGAVVEVAQLDILAAKIFH